LVFVVHLICVGYVRSGTSIHHSFGVRGLQGKYSLEGSELEGWVM